ncbi:type I restriction enzyme HsdR N-terminal domain-containing protein [Spongiivirga citrea]|uniref:Restriction endonuclease subunit R n=1 Tax=Spongiivirga citrea TaxID=1481457 RepID=A0A6M0CFS7_9FLAO|nr:type I restriction enzyme HsdR N-terminal domain-containing protein [Spongiivirga citrea]NER16685.1 restriction endonuclease subunit R [Spongiivirga citrea]
MLKLSFPDYQFRLKNKENKTHIFDPIRKKFVVLTPEEWVRQHTLQFLMIGLQYPASHINVEKELVINSIRKRYDIVVYSPTGDIHVLVECKAPQIKINQDTFDQIARYNMTLNASYLMVTNGLNHYYCTVDHSNESYTYLPQLPSYQQK